MDSLLHSLGEALCSPVLQLFDPGKRVFAPFLLAACLLGLLLHAPMRSTAQRLRELFSPAIYLHPSARLDFKLLWVKALLRATLLAPLIVSALAITQHVHLTLRSTLGAPPILTLSPLAIGLLSTLVLFLCDDLSHFLLHYFMHRIPWLWALHKVHHSAEVLTPFSLYRIHPLEGLLSQLRGALVVGSVTGVMVYLFGPRLYSFELLGVDAIGFLWSLCGANLRHSHVFLRYGPRWEQALLSPAQHQLHHSAQAEHSDRNFGTVLAIWDRLFGTLLTTTDAVPPRFGLTDTTVQPYPTVKSALLTPLQEILQMLTMDRKKIAAHFRTVLGLGSILLLLGCTSSKRLDRAALLQSIGEASLLAYRGFEAEAAILAKTTSEDTQSPSEASRKAWQSAMAAWQKVEQFQIGPLASAPSPGAQGLRNKIYIFPEQNRCLIDQQLVSRLYEGELFAAATDESKGLGALEYLLFYQGTDNGCSADTAINATGSWAALSQDELKVRKRAYAKAAAAEVLIHARELLSAWEKDKGNFLTQLASAGQGSQVFATQQAALNAVSDGLFYLEVVSKDRKLAQPLGLKNCTKMLCPEFVESPWADQGKEHLRNNLLGFRALFVGGTVSPDALGFDDLLKSVGAEEVSSRVLREVDGAQAAIQQLGDKTLSQALQADSMSVLRIHDALKLVTDTLKQDFTTALAIQPPRRVEGDHD